MMTQVLVCALPVGIVVSPQWFVHVPPMNHPRMTVDLAGQPAVWTNTTSYYELKLQQTELISTNTNTIPPITTRFSVVWSIIMSVVWHIYTLCLNHLMDFNAIWQIRLWGPGTRSSDGVPDPEGNGRLSSKVQLQIAADIWQIQMRICVYWRQWFCFLPNYFWFVCSLTKGWTISQMTSPLQAVWAL